MAFTIRSLRRPLRDMSALARVVPNRAYKPFHDPYTEGN